MANTALGAAPDELEQTYLHDELMIGNALRTSQQRVELS